MLLGGEGNDILHPAGQLAAVDRSWQINRWPDPVDVIQFNNFNFAGPDQLFDSDTQGDVAYGGNGLDKISGGQGNDVFYGEADNDTLHGNGGQDVLFGGSGIDVLQGGNDDDILLGGGDKDYLFGDGFSSVPGVAGNDTLDGGAGEDYLQGDDADLNLTVEHNVTYDRQGWRKCGERRSSFPARWLTQRIRRPHDLLKLAA